MGAADLMPGKPEFFWSPPDGAPIVGVTTFRGVMVVATATGVYTISNGHAAGDEWFVQKISMAVRENREPE